MKYFAIINDTQCGPYTLDQLVEAGVGPDTYVWCKGMSDWQQAREVADICRFFRNRIFDLMHPSASPARTVEVEESPSTSETTYSDIIRKIRETELTDEDLPKYEYPPRTWFFEAIILTLLCCPVTGIIAIYYGHKAMKLWKRGMKIPSHLCAKKAKTWCLYTLFFGLIIFALSEESK